MHEVVCPHCGKAFKIDEAGYADILKQVRDSEFEAQLHERLELAEQDKQNAVELTKARVAGELQKAAAAKDAEIQELKARLDAGEVARKLAVTEALSAVEKERDALANKLEQAKQDKHTASELAEAKLANELQRAAATKDSEIQGLKAKVDAIELSPDAMAVAKFNVAMHGLGRRVKLHHSDVFDAVPAVKYDLILSNPPYVPTRELRGLPEEFKQEPAMALDGGRDGLDIIRKLLRQSRDRLQPHGIVVLEVGGLRAAMDRAFPELDLHWLHTEDGEDCVCLVQAPRLKRWRDNL